MFTEAKFNSWFPNKNAIYTYDSFLKAVAKFPAFCNEGNTITAGEACKRELAALFSHIHHESDGLNQLEDPVCKNSISEADCGFKTAGVTSPATSFFYERGPLALKGDTEYAAFSKAFYEGYDRSEELLSYPNRVSEDGYFGFASALWKFMVPKKSEPSAHNVMTGFYVPNGADLQAGHTAGFGTTI